MIATYGTTAILVSLPLGNIVLVKVGFNFSLSVSPLIKQDSITQLL